MQTTTHFTYKGHRVTTQCSDVEPRSGQAVTWFNASFTVDPPMLADESWQQFPDGAFDSCQGAAANARAAAERSIDLDLILAAARA